MIEPLPQRRHTALIAGGTGFVGRHLCRLLLDQGWDVIVWRHRKGLPPALQTIPEIHRLQAIAPERRVDAVINLAGANILGAPWTRRRRQRLLDSRVGPTTELVQWLASRPQRPDVLLNASAVGYYGVRGAESVDESAGPQPIFQSELCRIWEEAAAEVTAMGVRRVMLRFGVVLGRDGGAYPALARPARLGLAAVMGQGDQGFPWIHIQDAVQLILWALDDPGVQGPVNAVAPGAVSQREFQQTLCEVLRRPLWLRVPGWPVRTALGEMAQLLLDGQYVEPARALRGGYRFAFPDLRAAIGNLEHRSGLPA